MNVQISYIEAILDMYQDIITPSRHGKLSCVTPRDAKMTQRIARLFSWRIHTILSSATGIFGNLSFRIITRLARSLSLIASQSSPALNRGLHEQITIVDSISGDLVDSISSILPRFEFVAMSFFPK
jgi:hypothetical protein